ncbi:MAG: cell division protein FtsQ [Cyclobacteriaceae bacterium]|nr:cell division protein FtsQ [Cyclobacteriaceae bacterium]
MKLNLNIRKEIRIAAALIALSFLIAFSERKQGGALCKDIVVEIENINDNHFLDEADILRLVEASGQTLKGTSISRIDLKAIEKKLKYDKHVKEAELYGDLKGNLIVNVELRRPIARIVQEDAPDAYISEEGIVMSISEKFTSRVVIISGRFVKQLLEKGDLMKFEEGKKLMEMLDFIREDKFWNAQIAQMDINSKEDITIYPQITGQLVEFGSPDNYEFKFKKLMVFYKEILPQKGWTKYERVNLKYEGQVIAE